MSELLVLVEIAGQAAALRAAQVQSLIEVEAIMPIPLAPDPVCGLATLRSAILTVIDCRRLLSPGDAQGATRPGKAAVIEHNGHGYALLLDAAHDVVPALGPIGPLPGDIGAGWARAARGMAETATGPVLVLDAHRLVAPLVAA